MKAISISKKNLCPVCGNHHGCKIQEDKWVLCLRGSSQQDAPPGYRFVKPLQNSMGGLFVADDGESDWNEEQRAQRQQEQELQRRQRDKAEAQRRAKLLSIEERDRQYRLVNKNLTLTPSHRQVLSARGLTDGEIDLAVELGAIRTWNPGQPVLEVSPDLAGVDPFTRSLAGVYGIAIYACDPNANIVGAQLKTDNESKGKYLWLSSRDRNGNGPQLPNDELPLFTWKHPNAQAIAEVWLCEGALKSLIVALKLWRQGRTDVVVIGTACAARYGEQTLQEYLAQIDASTIRLMPDAGAVINPAICKANVQTLLRCQQLGYSITVGWWGQVDKTHPDIDELEDFGAITYLTAEDFLGEHFHKKADEGTSDEAASKKAEEEVYRELTQLTATPWKEIHTPQINLEALELESGAIYVVKSAKATGKTNALIPLISNFRNVYAWFSRIALGREECNRIGVDWKDDLKTFNGNIKVGFCADSAFTFSPGHLRNNGLLLVDEADGVFEHTFGDTCNKGGKRPIILAALKAQLDAAIAGNGMVLFMSADITDKEVEYIKRLAPAGCPVRLIVNNYKPQLGEVYFDESETPDGLIENLLADLENNKPRFVIDDRRTGVRGCKSIAEYIRSIHPEWTHEVIEINSDTSGDPAIIEYLQNINTASLTTRLLICSPSVTSGVSIENGHFEEIYGFFNGVLTVSHASQAIARVRGAKSINVWCAEKGLAHSCDHSLFPEQIRGYFKRNYESNAQHILAFGVQYDAMKDEWDSPHFDLYCKNAAYRNCCMERLRYRLNERLIEEGYQVYSTVVGGSDMVKQGLKESWADLEITHAKAVASATILTDSELKILENTTLTPQQKLDVEKTFLLKNFGQELIDSMLFEHNSGEILTGFAAMLLKDKGGAYKRQLEAFYLLTSGAEVAIAKDLKSEERQLSHGKGRFAGDVQWNTRQRKAREFLGLHEFLNPEKWIEPLDFASLAQKAKKHAHLIKDALGFTVEHMTPGQIFGQLMEQLGLSLDKKWASGLSKQGRRYKLRQVNAESWNYAQMYARFRRDSLTQAEAPQPQDFESPRPVTSDHPPCSLSNERLGGGDQAQSHTDQAVEVVSTYHFSEPELEVISTPHGLAHPANSDHPLVSNYSEVERGGDQCQSHTQQGIEAGSVVNRWGWGRAKYVVESFVDDIIVQIKSLATGHLFNVVRSQLIPDAGGA